MATERPRHGWRSTLPEFATRDVVIVTVGDRPVARCRRCGSKFRAHTLDLLELWVQLHDAECSGG